ncbi:dolichol-phosphate mannosyltransferase [Aspergillus eucalypticola CBS 122712]|uniref:Dolichol-phosphate mannosyltransferase n=1 Tax=Aspergillus eucalypticola (strain CBS 122712 / IBT 29274) TaxID=1448314 RepID=A0A317V7U2_ASPEC|nr:dolichol-phosphate mannosyltransferase [Aspergillus eucalypticola CBS 122712]PWY70105.1 dolichol-phosphate mannosyltransferase [Aspergillus eucalypticola CBS 122712]
MSHPGILHHYAPRLVAFEFTPPNSTPSTNALLFIGGLTDGLLTVPYVPTLASALSTTTTTPNNKNTWSVFNVLLTTSYQGWGVNSLDRDIEDLAQCITYIRKLKGPESKIVIMGHSTGSQDVLHYLSAPNPVPHNPAVNGLQYLTRPPVDGAIMQAPVSDREGMHITITTAEARGAYEQLVGLAKAAVAEDPRAILPLNLTSLVGLDAETPVNAWRFLSLASPESPENPSQDDLFSADLGDEKLRETFGVVGERGLLGGRLMALYSGADEYRKPGLDVEGLMKRWQKATDEGAGEVKWDAEGSAVIEGASHNVQDVGQEELVERVRGYLARL